MQRGDAPAGQARRPDVLTVDLVAVVVEAHGVRHHLVGRDEDLPRMAAVTLRRAERDGAVRGVEAWRVQVVLS